MTYLVFKKYTSNYMVCVSARCGGGGETARGEKRLLQSNVLVAVRLSVQHFLPELTGHRVLLHEDNMAVVYILTNMVSRSPELMFELRHCGFYQHC